MKETYISLGPAVTPFTCFLSILTFALLFALFYLRKHQNLAAWTVFSVTTWNAACLWLLPPHAIHFAGLVVSIGIGIMIDRQRAGNLKRSEARFAALFLPMGAILVCFLLINFYRQDVIIDADFITQTGTFRGTINAKRGDIRLHASKIARTSIVSLDGWSWTIFSKDDVGPKIYYNEVYFHELRFIRGEDLGAKISKWARVQPKYTLYVRDPNDADKIIEASR